MDSTHPDRDLAPVGGRCAGCTGREIGICSVLPAGFMGTFAAGSVAKAYPPGSVIVHEGDDALTVHNLQSGVVMLSKAGPGGRRQVLGFRSGGDFIGLCQSAEYPFTMKALTAVRACKFSNDAFHRLMEQEPKLEHELLARAAEQVTESHSHAVLLGRKTAAERVASFVLWLSDREAARSGDGETIVLPMTRADIADYLGLTIETVSRGITALKTSGVIRLLAHNTVRILKRDVLETIAAGE